MTETGRSPSATAYLEVWHPGGPQLYPLVGDQVTIGRHPDCDLIVEHDGSVSRRHARIEALAGGWGVQDLGSSAGTTVSGHDVIGMRALCDGDELQLGRTRLVFRQTVPDAVAPTEGVVAPPELTRRERDVLIALCRPLLRAAHTFNEPASLREIATELVVTDAAVKQHLQRLYEKFGLEPRGDGRRRVLLANEAIRRRAVALSDLT
ncbi:MAG: FHA domain-containing protein [Pseudonocardia sp.]|nr:FHA domain-containing protein [Pseudonocardia sp.]